MGRQKNDNCIDDTDCDTGMYCRVNTNWPYQTKCTQLKTEFEFCENDFECQNHQFCWYPDEENRKNNGLKTCLSLYSQPEGTKFGWFSESEDEPTLEDFKQNGKYCESGLAYPYSQYGARCTEMKEMKWDGAVLEQPYPCNPTQIDKKCELHFEIYDGDNDYVEEDGKKRNFVENQCKCALDGKTNNGDCSSFKDKEKCPVSGQVNQTLSQSRGYCSSIMGHALAKQAY